MKTSGVLTAPYLASLLVLAAATPITNLAGGATPQTSSEISLNVRSSGIQGMQYCGVFANADGGMASQLAQKLGQGGLRNHDYSVAAHGCNRVQCWDTSGIYVCNDNDHDIAVAGEQISAVAKLITSDCCTYSASKQEMDQKIMAGQQFTQWGWNVVVAYADCNAPLTIKPSEMGGYGVNGGTCMAYSGMVTNG